MSEIDYAKTGLVLADLTWGELNDVRDLVDLVLIPVGSTEQHGPNLAMRMDGTAAFEFSRRASMRMAPRLLVAPVIPWGVSQHHMNFPGTITLTPDTFIQVILEVVQSLQHHGFERFLIVNGHGGNVASMELAALRARMELQVPFIGACSYFSFSDPAIETKYGVGKYVGHACEIETSTAMYLSPEIVREGELAAGELTDLNEFYSEMEKYRFMMPLTFDEFTQNGALGDARNASLEFGRELIESGLDNFCAFIEKLLASPYAGETSSPGVQS